MSDEGRIFRANRTAFGIDAGFNMERKVRDIAYSHEELAKMHAAVEIRKCQRCGEYRALVQSCATSGRAVLHLSILQNVRPSD